MNSKLGSPAEIYQLSQDWLIVGRHLFAGIPKIEEVAEDEKIFQFLGQLPQERQNILISVLIR